MLFILEFSDWFRLQDVDNNIIGRSYYDVLLDYELYVMDYEDSNIIYRAISFIYYKFKLFWKNKKERWLFFFLNIYTWVIKWYKSNAPLVVVTNVLKVSLSF